MITEYTYEIFRQGDQWFISVYDQNWNFMTEFTGTTRREVLSAALSWIGEQE